MEKEDRFKKMKDDAEYYRELYRKGVIGRELAKTHIQPYLDFVNDSSSVISKKYGQRYKKVNFSGYIR